MQEWGYDKEKDFDETFRCACHSAEHQLEFCYISENNDEDNAMNEVYVQTFLSPTKGFFGRVWAALGYIFGYNIFFFGSRPQYGHFDCFVLREKDMDKLISLVTKARDEIKEARERQEKSVETKE